MIAGRGLVVTRGGRRILDVPKAGVAGGEVLGILGANGAGKSTLLRCLAGELRPDAGEVLLFGRAIGAWPPVELARRRAVMPQASALGFPLRAREVVALGRTPHAGRAGNSALIAAAMAETGTTLLAERWYGSLSGGEQQRVQLARVLAQLGDVREAALFLDEPTASLDLPHQRAILEAAARRAAAGAAVVVVLHDVALAARHCTRIMLLAEGRVMADGDVAEVLTPALLGAAYGVALRRVPDPEGGVMLFVPA